MREEDFVIRVGARPVRLPKALTGNLSDSPKKLASSTLISRLAVAAGVLGEGVKLQAPFCPNPIQASLAALLATDRQGQSWREVQFLVDPVRKGLETEFADLRIQQIQQQIQELELERQAFFCLGSIHHPLAHGSFEARLAVLQRRLRSQFILLDNPMPGDLHRAIQRAPGCGLVLIEPTAATPILQAARKQAQNDLRLSASAWHGRSIDLSGGKGPPVLRRTAISLILICSWHEVGALLCVDKLPLKDLVEIALVSDGSDLVQFLDCPLERQILTWPGLMDFFTSLREANQDLLVRLSADAWLQLTQAMECWTVRAQGWVAHWPMLACKLGLLFHLCQGDVSAAEVSGPCMADALALANWLLGHRLGLETRALEQQQQVRLQREAAAMLWRIKAHAPLDRWTLFRSYRNQAKSRHEPVLKHLMGRGEVRISADGLIVLA